jgi:hypothetical protein
MAWASGEKEQAISRFSIDQDDRLEFSGMPAPHCPAGSELMILTAPFLINLYQYQIVCAYACDC